MGRRRAYERAQARVVEILDLLGEGDDVISLPFSGPRTLTVPAPTGDFDRIGRQFAEMAVSSGNTDAGKAVATGLQALREGENLNRELYLITDMHREGFTQTVIPPASTDDQAVTVYVIDVSEDDSFDLAVDGVQIGDQLIEVGSPFDVSATVTNHSGRPVERLLVSLFIDGRRVAQEDVAVGADGTVTVPYTATIETPGIHTGFVEVSADDNPLNNRRYFALAVPDKIRILLASDYPSGRVAPRLALAPRPNAVARLDITETDTDGLLSYNFFDYDCVVINEWRRPDAAVVSHLMRYVRAGGGAFIAPSVDADTTAWNELIATPHFGLRLGANPPMPNPERYFIWDAIDWSHPIWSVYRDVRRDKVPEIRWYSIYRTEGTPQGRSLVDFSGGRPSLTEIQTESGKLIALWSSPNPPYTDLPLRSAFVPFMHRLVEYLAADVSEQRGDVLVGEDIEREPPQPVGANAVIELTGPDGFVERPSVEWAGRRVKVRIGPKDLPGVYALTEGENALDAFAVNIDPAESAPEKIDRDELSRRWAGYNIVFIEPGNALGDIVNQTRYGTEIRGAFLWAVMALFFIEMFLARTRKRDIPLGTATLGGAPSHAGRTQLAD